MTEYAEFLKIPPYSLKKEEKRKLLMGRLQELSQFHYENCREYRGILNALSCVPKQVTELEQFPFLPVRLFKERELRSIKEEEIFKTLTSSGTSGQTVSKIYLDRETASYQQKTLAKIVSDFTGSARLPMILIDSSSVIKNRAMFSARGAGILGFSMFATEKIYALDDMMQLNLEDILVFLEKHRGKPILLFGFTFMIWQHFYKELKKITHKIDLSNAVLIHGGGWKKLISEAVTREEFKFKLQEVCGIQRIFDYYGLVEQMGCIYMECEKGHLHTSIFSDLIIRNSMDFKPCEFGEKGIIEVMSLLPESYPGHVLLTEDEGILLGEDDCPCGRYGKYLQITGRMKSAEIRGCSDTYAAEIK